MKKEYFSLRSVFMATAVAVSGLVLVGCDKNDDDVPDTPVAGLMAANLATDKPSIGVSLSGNPLGSTPIGYTNYTGGYLPIFTGTRTVAAYDFTTGTGFTSSNYNFEADEYYSLYVVGANNNYSNIIVNDDFSSLSSTSGKAYVRYVNAVPDSSQSTVTVSVEGNNAVNELSAYASVSNFVEVDPGSVTIEVSNGSTIDATRTVTFEAGKVYTILLVGDPNAPSGAVEIRYIENGSLDDDAGRTVAGAQVAITS